MRIRFSAQFKLHRAVQVRVSRQSEFTYLLEVSSRGALIIILITVFLFVNFES
jgi:hypothetical protein